MRTLIRNRQPFWYCPYLGVRPVVDDHGLETGEQEVQYGEPVLVYGNISAAGGVAQAEQFGTNLNYDRVIVLEDPDFPIDENSVLFVDKLPEPEPEKRHYDYTVRSVARSLNSVSYAIRRVDVS